MLCFNNFFKKVLYIRNGEISLTGFLLILPIFLIRYGLLSIINRDALKRAAYYPPVEGKEKVAFGIFQLTMNFMFIYLIFLDIKLSSLLNFIGLGIYLIGMILYTISTVDFARIKGNGLNCSGLYKITRNPMYVSFFLYFLGCSMVTNSWILIIVLVIFQISSHYIILSEERWCKKEFGAEYTKYTKKVRRYI